MHISLKRTPRAFMVDRILKTLFRKAIINANSQLSGRTNFSSISSRKILNTARQLPIPGNSEPSPRPF